MKTRRWLHSEDSQAAQSYTARKNSWFSPTIFVLGFIPVFTFALGTWQMQRLQWKVALIDELQEKLHREPIFLPKRVKCVHHSIITESRLSRSPTKSICRARVRLSSSVAPW
jgi:hypothetical protein